MSVDAWKSFLDFTTVTLLFLTFVAGAGVLVIGNIINERQSKQIKQFDKDLTTAKSSLAQAERGVAEANAEAEGFRLEIARAKEGAARATETAERERLARLQLEARLADRFLTPAQQARIAAGLRVFGPRWVDVLIVGITPEISRMADAIGVVVTQAGWIIGNMGTAMGGSAAGVQVGTLLGSAQDASAAADCLTSLLREAGISSDRIPQYSNDLPGPLIGYWNTSKTAPIRVIIGTKP